MTKQELIDHLEHLADYVKYSEDAPALREVIKTLKCSEMPNGSDTISRQAAITAIQKAYADTEGGTDKCAVWKNVGLTNALHIMQDLPSARSIEAQKAYYLGMIDGVKECTARVKKVNEEINNARTKE